MDAMDLELDGLDLETLMRESRSSFSPRELEMIELIKEGAEMKDINIEMGVSRERARQLKLSIKRKIIRTQHSLRLREFLKTIKALQ